MTYQYACERCGGDPVTTSAGIEDHESKCDCMLEFRRDFEALEVRVLEMERREALRQCLGEAVEDD